MINTTLCYPATSGSFVADYGTRCASPASRLPVPIGELATASAVHEPGSPTVVDFDPPAEHQGCGQQATLPRQTNCVSSYSHVFVRAPPCLRHAHHGLPLKVNLEINRRRYAPRTVGKSRACQVVPTTPGQGSLGRGGQSVTIDSAILTTSSQSEKGASMPAARAGVIPSSSSCGRKRL